MPRLKGKANKKTIKPESRSLRHVWAKDAEKEAELVDFIV
jgi:hypothetical protein